MTSQDSPQNIEIEPISFRTGRPQGSSGLNRVLKWLLVTMMSLLFLSLAAGVWFVFTAKQVVVSMNPVPDRMSLDGGMMTPHLGDYYLLRPGLYRLSAEKQGYHPVEQSLRVSHEKSQMYNLTMTKLPGKITFNIHQDKRPDIVPVGGIAFIDGKKIGEIPLKEIAVAAGKRHVRINTENYQEFNSELLIKGMGESQVFDFGLIPAWADVTVRTVPLGAEIRVDGRPLGKTPLQFRLTEGSHDLSLSAKRFKTLAMRLDVKANQSKLLENLRLIPEDGILKIESQPSGANVTVDGKFIGRTPLTIPVAPEVSHTINMSKAGYENYTEKIALTSAEKKPLSIKLSPQKGTIYLSVKPRDAVLIINGRRYGTVPGKIELIATRHHIEIKKKNYVSHVVDITPRPGFPQQVAVVLKEISTVRNVLPETVKTTSGYALKLIQPNVFTMGSSRREQGRRSNESLRKVSLTRPFYMGIREVTNREFKKFISVHNSGIFKSQTLDRKDQPVVQITWKQAALFCNWLSNKEGLPPVYTVKGDRISVSDPMKTGYRLPTEAEWEYCARFTGNGGSQKYPWGNAFPPPDRTINIADISAKGLLPAILDTYDDGYPAAAPPGAFKPNKQGMHDLGGNVSEWCHDFYTIYPYSSGKVYVDPVGPTEGKHHVVRGSSWRHAGISAMRAAYRDYSNNKRPDLGFRVARYAK